MTKVRMKRKSGNRFIAVHVQDGPSILTFAKSNNEAWKIATSICPMQTKKKVTYEEVDEPKLLCLGPGGVINPPRPVQDEEAIVRIIEEVQNVSTGGS
jgi:hypothetical protein